MILSESLVLGSLLLIACSAETDKSPDSGASGSFVTSVISYEGGELKIAGGETGIVIPAGAVETDVEITLAMGTVDDFASNEDALDDVLVFTPFISLAKAATLTIQLADIIEIDEEVHLEQFIDDAWRRPKLNSVEIRNGIVYGVLETLAPTAIVFDAVAPN